MSLSLLDLRVARPGRRRGHHRRHLGYGARRRARHRPPHVHVLPRPQPGTPHRRLHHGDPRGLALAHVGYDAHSGSDRLASTPQQRNEQEDHTRAASEKARSARTTETAARGRAEDATRSHARAAPEDVDYGADRDELGLVPLVCVWRVVCVLR